MLAMSAPSIQASLSKMEWRDINVIVFSCFIIVVLIKIIMGVGLLLYSENAQRKADAKFYEMGPTDCAVGTPGIASKQSKLEMVEELATIERYTVYKGRIL